MRVTKVGTVYAIYNTANELLFADRDRGKAEAELSRLKRLERPQVVEFDKIKTGTIETEEITADVMKVTADLMDGSQVTGTTRDEAEKLMTDATDPEDALGEIADLSFQDLRRVAKEQEIDGYIKMKKVELIAEIEKKIAEAQGEFTQEEELPFDDDSPEGDNDDPPY